jgi:solute carrier family 25 carnitine/acylcarnitine transporter 20/29
MPLIFLRSTLVTPIELLKIRQQVAAAEGQPMLTTYDTARQVFRESGLRGLYRGITTTALRDIGYGVYFLTVSPLHAHDFLLAISCHNQYEASTRLVAQLLSPEDTRSEHAKRTPAPWPVLLLSGGLAGAAGWLFTFPFDVLKTRIQAGDAPANSLAALRVVYREGGWGVFWRGLAPTLIR